MPSSAPRVVTAIAAASSQSAGRGEMCSGHDASEGDHDHGPCCPEGLFCSHSEGLCTPDCCEPCCDCGNCGLDALTAVRSCEASCGAHGGHEDLMSEEELQMILDVLAGIIPAGAKCQATDFAAMMAGGEPETADEAVELGASQACAACVMGHAPAVAANGAKPVVGSPGCNTRTARGGTLVS